MRQSPTPISKQRLASQQISKPRQALAQSKDPPDQWQCLTGRGIHPCLMGRRLVAIVIGAHVVRAFAVISPTSHHGVWGGASFKINGKKRQFLSQLTKEQKSKASGLAPHYLYRRGKPKQPFGTHARDSARCARSLGFFCHQSHAMPHSLRVGTEPARQQHRSTQHGEAARK
jgi:hypothetical protein